MKTKVRWLTALVALALALAACGSGDAEGAVDSGGNATEAENSTADSDQSDADDETDSGDNAVSDDDEMSDDDAAMSEDDAMSDDNAMSEDDAAMSEDDDEMSDEEMADALLGDLNMVSFFWPGEGDPPDDVLACVEDKGVDITMSPFAASEEDIMRASVVTTGCGADEMAQLMSGDVTPPPGTDQDDVECVMFETFDYIGSIPVDDAIALLGQSESISDPLRDLVTPRAEEACGISTEQIAIIFDS